MIYVVVLAAGVWIYLLLFHGQFWQSGPALTRLAARGTLSRQAGEGQQGKRDEEEPLSRAAGEGG
jgi:hypothetical protein